MSIFREAEIQITSLTRRIEALEAQTAKFVIIVLPKDRYSRQIVDLFQRTVVKEGFHPFIFQYGDTINVFRLDNSLEQIDIERIEQMCREASK